jgi:3-methyladenine DNA glycosylase AlkD
MTIEDLKKQLRLFANVEKATILQRFFKTGKGQYGEGDIFLGVIVPDTRKVAKKFVDITLPEIKEILYSKVHEERLCALLLLVEKFSKADDKEREKIFNFYIKNAKQANNWDLVDLSAPKIVGEYFLNKEKNPGQIKSQFDGINILYKLAKSKNLWEKRIAIVSTYTFIKNKKLNDTFKIAEILMNDKHDLIHKAVGWMLREAGKRSIKDEENFCRNIYPSQIKKISLTGRKNAKNYASLCDREVP